MAYGAPRQLAQNKFFDPSPPSMRKVDDIGKKTGKGGGDIISFIVATNVVGSRPLECRPTGTPTAPANLH